MTGTTHNPDPTGVEPTRVLAGPSEPTIDLGKAERIVIGSDDLHDGTVNERVDHLVDAQKVPLVRAVGDSSAAPTTGGGAFSWKAVAIMAGAGVLGGLLVWLAWQMIGDQDSALVANLLFSFSMVFVIGLTVTAADVVRTGALQKLGKTLLIGLPVAFGAALAFGFMAHLIYTGGTDAIFQRAFDGVQYEGWSEQRAYDYMLMWNHPVRGAAWALVGLAVGLTVGLASRSARRTIITVIGGLVGGFLGGFLFDFMTTEDSAQVLGLAVTGMLIGLSIAVFEEGRKSTWIEIAAGGMAGKQFILYQDVVTVGSSPDCNITVIKDPAVLPLAATITRRGAQSEIAAPQGSTVNVDGALHAKATLRDGSVISLGGTVLQFREKSKDSAEIGSVRR